MLTRRQALLATTTLVAAAALPGPANAANVAQFGTDYLAAVSQLVAVLNQLDFLSQRVAENSTLFDAYLATPGARPDLNASKFANANDAVGQILSTYKSGSPTQRAKLFELL